ncbi:MAG: secretin N-terminal domain-containing protein [Planctomycetota bacterium]
MIPAMIMTGLVSLNFASAAMAQPGANPRAGQPGGPPNGRNGGKPNGDQPGKEKSGDGKSDGEKKSDEQPEPKVIRRDTVEGEDADPDELKATVGADGKVAFQFRNQPWVDLIQWLADISDQPLDWQELPGDKVNLASPGRYTVEQTRDLFNRHLLARGYTLLELDGGITVMKTASINPGMVRRVGEMQLHELQPHTFVRTLMDAGWLPAEKLAEELKPMISGNGRLTALTTTNRIEAMDAAVNLRQIAELLQQERDVSSRDALAPEFRLVHVAAEEAKTMLETFLGVQKKSNAPMSPQQIQMMQRMQQQNGGSPPTVSKEPEIAIVANTRQNSVLVRAPRDKIAIASEFIRRIDVASESIRSLEDIKARVEAFRLQSLDAEKLIEIVSEMNVLQPTTRIRVDKDNSAVVVSGPAVDRYIVKSLIDQLDGSGRQFEVLQLRRLSAQEVAESIAFLMGQEDEDEDQNSSRRYYYYGYGDNDDDDSEVDQFRVAPNARYNQVLLWANENEMEEVRSLLIKLGELPPPGGSRKTFRVVEAASTPETYDYLQRLQQQFESVSGKTLAIPQADEFKDPIPPADDDENDSDDEDDAGEGEEASSSETDENQKDEVDGEDGATDQVDRDENELTDSMNPFAVRLAATNLNPTSDDQQLASDSIDKPATKSIESMEDFDRQFRQRVQQAADASRKEVRRKESPIQISLDRDGNLVLSSEDTEALDQLEEMMLQIRPPQREYVVFRLKHARASMIKIDLTEYFSTDEEDEESEADRFYRFWFNDDTSDSSNKPAGLAGGNKLKFVYNIETNTLIVSGASSGQLQTIRELIELWDVPEPVDEKLTRFTKLIAVRYGRAEKIADTLKEAYRDLLSGNDKAFNKNQGNEGKEGRGEGAAASEGGGLEDSQSGQESGGGNYNFKGKLSFGIDEVGNTLLISAEGKQLLDLMEEMVRQLDEAAQPGGQVEVLQLDGNVSGESLQEALKAFGLKNDPAKNRRSERNRSGPIPDPTNR